MYSQQIGLGQKVYVRFLCKSLNHVIYLFIFKKKLFNLTGVPNDLLQHCAIPDSFLPVARNAAQMFIFINSSECTMNVISLLLCDSSHTPCSLQQHRC